MRRAGIAEQNRYLLPQQHEFRRAAGIVAGGLAAYPAVEAVAVAARR